MTPEKKILLKMPWTQLFHGPKSLSHKQECGWSCRLRAVWSVLLQDSDGQPTPYALCERHMKAVEDPKAYGWKPFTPAEEQATWTFLASRLNVVDPGRTAAQAIGGAVDRLAFACDSPYLAAQRS